MKQIHEQLIKLENNVEIDISKVLIKNSHNSTYYFYIILYIKGAGGGVRGRFSLFGCF